jgi:hypothetical protein
MLHQVACTRLLADFQCYLSKTSGPNWLKLRNNVETNRSQGPFPNGKHAKGGGEGEGEGEGEVSVHGELLKDLHKGIDAISRSFGSD